jgi:hypothetical protein
MRWSPTNKLLSKDVIKRKTLKKRSISESSLEPIPEKSIIFRPKHVFTYTSPRGGDLFVGELLLSKKSKFSVVPQILENKALDKFVLKDFPNKEFPQKAAKKKIFKLPCASCFTTVKQAAQNCKPPTCNFKLLFSRDFWMKRCISSYKSMVSFIYIIVILLFLPVCVVLQRLVFTN